MTVSTSVGRLTRGASLPTLKGYEVRVVAWRGEGSYARVYRGIYSRTAGPCALKLAKREIPEAGARLQREARILATVEHPCLVALLDGSLPGEPPALVLEWLEGETLLDLVAARRRLALRQALEITESVLGALSALHARKVTHGDVRPENVIVTPGRGTVLTDPDGDPPDPAGDLLAAGKLFYRMLTGEDPDRTPARLTVAAGHNKLAVDLWERMAAPDTSDADKLLAMVRLLRASL